MIKRIIKAYRRHKILQAIHRRRARILSHDTITDLYIVLDVLGMHEPVYQVYYSPSEHHVVWKFLYCENSMYCREEVSDV